MENFSFLYDLIAVFATSGIVVFLFQWLKLPSVIGLLVAGVFVGPHGLSLIEDEHRVHVLAEIGLVVLLFTVGLEFSLVRVARMWRLMLGVGVPQVALSAGLVGLGYFLYSGEIRSAIFLGMLAAFSSTAIVLKELGDAGDTTAPHGRISIAVLLFQDLLVMLCMLAVPLLAGSKGEDSSLWLSLAKGVGLVGLLLIISRYFLDRVLFQIVATRNRELFLFAVIVICIGTAALTASVGLSLALGAFIAGLILADSEYGHQTMSEVLPFRDTLSSLFFVSVGMLLDLRYLVSNFIPVLAVLLLVLLIKSLTAFVPTFLSRYPIRTSVLVGLSLAQVGEFSFVLANRGMEYKLIPNDAYQMVIAVTVLSMAATPFLMRRGEWLAKYLRTSDGILRGIETDRMEFSEDLDSKELSGHVVVAGFGLNGRTLSIVLKEHSLPYVILEMNPHAVKKAKAQGENIHFADCTRATILEHFGIKRAKVFVVGVSDSAASRRAVKVARLLNPDLRIIVRNRFARDVEEYMKLGANRVISEDFETSIQMVSSVMSELDVSGAEIDKVQGRIRGANFEQFRKHFLA